jgi:hypothetical protein
MEWVKCTLGLPMIEGEDVGMGAYSPIVMTTDGRLIALKRLFIIGKEDPVWVDSFFTGTDVKEPTYWMYFPEAPKE